MNVSIFYYNPMDGEVERIQRELLQKMGSDNDPERPPLPKRGDEFIFFGLVIGLIIGGIVGSFFHFFVYIIVGAIIGALLGILAGNAISRHIRKTSEH